MTNNSPIKRSSTPEKHDCPFSTLEKQQVLKAIEYRLPSPSVNENDKKHLRGIAKKLRIIIEDELERAESKS
ncbi:hypothetical protein [Pseudoalteromonas sp. JC28]|uniref:hypothetical protein n=1 Tax=Pseudoalteromonas sp. JC28 TaxID=2267617 RepID=UPI001573C862|nr:hypothetical protein [Pseudoalteromonas sp. JC28]